MVMPSGSTFGRRKKIRRMSFGERGRTAGAHLAIALDRLWHHGFLGDRAEGALVSVFAADSGPGELHACGDMPPPVDRSGVAFAAVINASRTLRMPILVHGRPLVRSCGPRGREWRTNATSAAIVPLGGAAVVGSLCVTYRDDHVSPSSLHALSVAGNELVELTSVSRRSRPAIS